MDSNVGHSSMIEGAVESKAKVWQLPKLGIVMVIRECGSTSENNLRTPYPDYQCYSWGVCCYCCNSGIIGTVGTGTGAT